MIEDIYAEYENIINPKFQTQPLPQAAINQRMVRKKQIEYLFPEEILETFTSDKFLVIPQDWHDFCGRDIVITSVFTKAMYIGMKKDGKPFNKSYSQWKEECGLGGNKPFIRARDVLSRAGIIHFKEVPYKDGTINQYTVRTTHAVNLLRQHKIDKEKNLKYFASK